MQGISQATTGVAERPHLGKRLASILEVPRRELELLTKSSRLLLAELELKIDYVFLATEVANDFAKLLDGAVVARGDSIDAFEGFGSGAVLGRTPALEVSGLRAEALEVLVEDGVLRVEVVAPGS